MYNLHYMLFLPRRPEKKQRFVPTQINLCFAKPDPKIPNF